MKIVFVFRFSLLTIDPNNNRNHRLNPVLPKSVSGTSLLQPGEDSFVDDSEIDEKLFNENRHVQIYSLQILSKMIRELTNWCQWSNGNSSRLGNFNFQPVSELLDRCRLQKTLLHCLYATINPPALNSMAESILHCAKASITDPLEVLNSKKQTQFAYVSELITAIESLIHLERVLTDNQTMNKINRGISVVASKNVSINEDEDWLLTINKKLAYKNNQTAVSLPQAQQPMSTRYIPQQSICNQSMFISSVLHYLKNMSLIDYHMTMLKLIRNSLASAGNALKSISAFVIEQLCRNLLYITNGGYSGGSSSGGGYLMPSVAYMSAISTSINIPDLIISIIKQLSHLLHYCLLNSSSSNNLNEISSSNSLFAQFLASIANYNDSQMKQLKQLQGENEVLQSQTKDHVLTYLHSILSSMSQVWQRCNLLLNSNGMNGVNLIFDSNANHQIATHNLQVNSYHNQYSWILGHPVVSD